MSNYNGHTTGHARPALPRELGDFTTTPRVVWIALCAVGIGILSAYVALALLRLIGLFTNLFFFHRWNTALTSPANNQLGAFEILVPVGGSIIVGLMARYGSEHGRRSTPLKWPRLRFPRSFAAIPSPRTPMSR